MSDEQQQPPGFPGSDRSPLDVVAERDARIDQILGGADATDPEAPAKASADPTAEGDDAPPVERVETEPEPEPEPEPAQEPPAEAQPDPGIGEALEQVRTLQQQLDERMSSLTEREREIAERAQRIERYERFAEAAESQNFLDAVEQLGWNPDDVTKAIVEGRGVRAPQDKLRSEFKDEVEQVRSELRKELEQLRSLHAEREAAERQALVTRSIDEERAPLLASFGERGANAVLQRLESAMESGQRVTSDQVASAVDEVEAQLSREFLATALKSQAVRRKYGKILGIRDQAQPVSRGRSPSNRDASQVSRRAETEQLSEQERLERALRHLE